MTDDTPTERFDSSDPTRQLPAAVTVERPRSRALLFTLIGVGAALLIAIIILAVLLFGRDDTPTPVIAPTVTPTATTPTETPTATETPEPTESLAPPAATGPTFDSFSAPTSAGCTGQVSNADLTFSWSSSDATTASISVGDSTTPYESDLPPVATYTNLQYPCDFASQDYTVTLEDADGNLAHKTVTITQ